MGLVQSQKQYCESFGITLTLSQKSQYLHLQITPPKTGDRLLNDIVCVLDNSGSMGQEATVKNSEGIKESQGYSLLDILKHAVKTIIYNLNENDRFGLVSFSDYGKELFSLTYMNAKQKEKANEQLDNIYSDSSTNLWDGLLKGSEMLRKSSNSHRQKVIVLLTDGEPNSNPPKGILPTYKDYLQKNSSFNYTLHTLALGKQMDSALLSSLAEMGGGQFSFIPCAGFMGTIFVNTLSNILCTCASNARLEIKPKKGIKIESIIGYQNKEIVEIGDIKYGQSQDIIIKIDSQQKVEDPNELIDVKLYYNDFQSDKICYTSAIGCTPTSMFDYHLSRLTLIQNIRKALQSTLQVQFTLPDISKEIQEVKELIAEKIKQQEEALEEIDLDQQDNHPLVSSLEYLKNIEQDIKGEITLAFSKIEWFNQWGQHYIPSLLMCHQKQTCNNFKDPGIKLYGGELFRKIKQQTEDTFLSLTPPKPSKQKSSTYQQSYQPQQQKAQQQPQPQQQQNFSVYYDAGGGCFSE